MPYFEWQAMDNRQDRRQYIIDALYKAGWKGPDAAGDASSSTSLPEDMGKDAKQPSSQNGSNGASDGEHPADEGIDAMRERERRLALLPLDRKSGADSVILQRQKAARGKR